MSEPERSTIFLAKAIESLAGAESEFVNGRFNNCANRCYYACFQVAIATLLRTRDFLCAIHSPDGERL